VWGAAELEPPIAAIGAAPTRDAGVLALVRGRLEVSGPTTEAELAAWLQLGAADVADGCARLEGEGLILRGRFTPGATANEWCDRRLLARIHRLTLGRLRREIEPVNPGDLWRFLQRWQHAAPGTQLHGAAGLLEVIDQLAGFEAAVGAWEQEIFPARIAGYDPAHLDELCLSGEVMWGRRSHTEAGITTRATPIAFWRREQLPWMVAPRPDPEHGPGAVVARVLAARGALFYAELLDATGLGRAELDDGLWALVAGGRVSADGFAALRALAGTPRTRKTGRWALLATTPASAEVAAEAHARQLLRRTGVVLRELTAREELPPWRDILLVLRRMEARGEIRGGRFAAGFVGEQFALPEAVEALRAGRGSDAPLPQPPPRDPLYVRALAPPPTSASATSSPGALSPASLLVCS
jgi:ATP-dependent Lhr-like helicase